MTAPLMPFSVPLEPILNAYAMNIPAVFRTHNSSQEIQVPAGVVLMKFTWDGREALRYRIVKNGQSGPWITVIAESPVIQARSSKLLEFAFTDAVFQNQTNRGVSQETIAALCRAGVTVIPMAGPAST